MSTFDDDEKSVQDSRPRDFAEISHGATVYRLALGQRDVIYNGFRFAATAPIARAELVVNPISGNGNADMTISLSTTHALAQRYIAMGSPPRQILVTLRRMQLTSGQVEQLWIGYVTSMSIDKHEAKLLVPSRTSQSLARRLPSVLVDTVCQHILYDGGCKADRVANTYAAHVTFVDGRNVNVAFDVAYPAGDQWARYGELVHVASGERMTITDQVGLQITMQSPIVECRNGDSLQIASGCAHDINTCKTKFANVVNYGGLPNRPTSDPFLPTGFGVIVS